MKHDNNGSASTVAEQQPTLSVRPSKPLSELSAYRLPPQPFVIDLPLGGTERPFIGPQVAGLAADTALLGDVDFGRYPSTRELEALLAQRLQVAPECIAVTAGADEAIDRICRSVLEPGRNVVLPHPTFEMIAHYARLAGAETRPVAWSAGAFPREAMLQAINKHTGLVAVVSPNNPSGGVATAADVRALAAAAPHALVLVDMAYGEYAEEDLMPAVLAAPNTIATRTLSKAWGMPGLRIGYAVGHPQVITWMRAAGGPYSVARPSVALALRRLQTGQPEVDAYVSRIRSERARLLTTVRELGGVAEPSQANFVLARFRNAAWVQQALGSLGIGARMFPQDPTLSDALRISCPGDEGALVRLLVSLGAAVQPEAIIFDLDGVLADVSGSYRQAIVSTAASFGVSVTSDEIQTAKAAGNANNDWILTQRLLSARGIEASLDEVTRRFEELYQGTPERAGLRQTETLLTDLDWLRRLKARFPLAIVTGRPRLDAERFLDQHGVSPYLHSMVCMEDAPLKPDPAPVRLCLERLGVRRAWMIGDTRDDIQAARAAGVVPIGVLPPGDDGARTHEVLTRAGAARVLDNVRELQELLS